MSQYTSVFENKLLESNGNNQTQQNYNRPLSMKSTEVFNPQNNYQQTHNGQTNLYNSHQQQAMNIPCLTVNRAACNVNRSESGTESHPLYLLPIYSSPTNNLLPQNIFDQTKAYLITSPILIVPTGSTNNNLFQNSTWTINPTSCMFQPIPLTFSHPIDIELNRRNPCTECKKNTGELICPNKDSLVSLLLQAIISQLLGIKGIIPCAVARILLKIICDLNVTDSIEETMETAIKCIKQLSKDQLLNESKTIHEVNGLLKIYLTSSSNFPKIISILTTVQLKINILKSVVDNVINAKMLEDQGYGTEISEPLDAVILELKNDKELRQLLAAFREKECEHRVLLNFAACNAERLITESKLFNIQRKIDQIEKEMERRHNYAN